VTETGDSLRRARRPRPIGRLAGESLLGVLKAIGLLRYLLWPLMIILGLCIAFETPTLLIDAVDALTSFDIRGSSSPSYRSGAPPPLGPQLLRALLVAAAVVGALLAICGLVKLLFEQAASNRGADG
jgi:hypothetical protein